MSPEGPRRYGHLFLELEEDVQLEIVRELGVVPEAESPPENDGERVAWFMAAFNRCKKRGLIPALKQRIDRALKDQDRSRARSLGLDV